MVLAFRVESVLSQQGDAVPASVQAVPDGLGSPVAEVQRAVAAAETVCSPVRGDSTVKVCFFQSGVSGKCLSSDNGDPSRNIDRAQTGAAFQSPVSDSRYLFRNQESVQAGAVRKYVFFQYGQVGAQGDKRNGTAALKCPCAQGRNFFQYEIACNRRIISESSCADNAGCRYIRKFHGGTV